MDWEVFERSASPLIVDADNADKNNQRNQRSKNLRTKKTARSTRDVTGEGAGARNGRTERLDAGDEVNVISYHLARSSRWRPTMSCLSCRGLSFHVTHSGGNSCCFLS